MLIDRVMPAFDAAAEHDTVVAAASEHVYTTIRHLDMSRSPAIRVLFAVRGLPRMFAGGASGRTRLTLDDFLRGGFVLLCEEPGAELVLGLVGAFWRPRGGVVRLSPAEFDGFARPGYAKAAWNFHVAPIGPNRTRVTTITRVLATDEFARRRFARYWRLVGPFSGVVRREILRLLEAEAEPTPA